MKEEMKVRRRNNLKGSVLFTVVAVMMVLIVFVMATLTIAGAANKRAYDSYSKNQTTYTAQAAIEATIEAMVNDANIATNINSLASSSGVGSQKTLTVSGDDALGSTTVTATNVGTVTQLDESTGKSVNKYVIELSATTTLSGESSTVSSYYIVDPVKTTPKTTKNSSASNGITIMGSLTSNGFQFNTYGGSSVGVGKDASRWVSVGADGIPTSNQYVSNIYVNDKGKTVSGFTINGSLTFTTSGNYEFNDNEGVRVFGDITISNPTNFISFATTSDYDSLPYIFAERNITLGSTATIGTETAPWVVYCGGTFNSTNTSFSIIGDVYIYDHDFSKENEDYSEYDESNVLNGTSYYGTSANSSLLSWTASLIYGDLHQIGGNLYTKGSLQLQQTTIGNDCYVKGDLTVAGLTTTIGGNLCVEGNINVSGSPLIVGGTVYCGGTVTGTIQDADGNEITDFTDTANKFGFPSDRESLDDIMILTTDDTTGFIETQPVEVSHYLDSSTGEYIYATEIPDNYIDAVEGTIYANSSNVEYSYVVDPNGEYVKEIYWDGSTGYRKKYWDGEEPGYDGAYYSIDSIVSSVEQLPSVITESCTIQGYIGKNIYINPGNNELWIKLDDVSLDGYSIIVDNSGTGTVNFYVPENGYFTINNHGSVVTTSALDGCYGGTELKSKYKSTDSEAGTMIPNIYFYSGNNATLTLGGNNGGVVTAYVYTPYATVNLPKGDGSSYNPSKYIDSYDIWNANKDSNGKVTQSVFDSLYTAAMSYDVDGPTVAIGAIVADQLSIQGGSGTANVFFVDNTVAQVKSTDDPEDDDTDPDDGSGIITVADNTSIQIISSYTNG